MFPTTRRLALCILLLALAGCAGLQGVPGLGPDVSLREVGAASPEIRKYKQLTVFVSGAATAMRSSGWSGTSTALEKAFVADVRSSGRFNVAEDGMRPQQLVAQLNVDSLRYVASGKPGAPTLKVTMTLKDRQNGRVLGTVSASAGDGKSEGSTEAQVDAVASGLADYLAAR